MIIPNPNWAFWEVPGWSETKTQNGRFPVLQEPDKQARAQADGKFLRTGTNRFHVRGVTYGPFRPDGAGCEYHGPEQVDRDFRRMAEAGINSVRVYTVPPRWLLDFAWKHGLRVMVGLPWEQHVAFLDSRHQRNDIERRVRQGVLGCANHPAILCFSIGNEIPATIVRWYGRARVEKWIERLYHAVKTEDPEALVTYVNFPSTEYLELPFLDVCAFNVYLESESLLKAYLARLQNLAGNRPLLMAEVGLDSMRNGQENQANALEWQIRTAFAEGCCGTFVFSWTDEWHRGGHDIDDWEFGLTDRHRRPKQALAAVANAYRKTPLPWDLNWPRISVVVCTYNGSSTIEETCQKLLELEYPDYEIIVVDDGSNDETPAILDAFHGIRVIHKTNAGLSAARNTGLAAANGEIVAYIDDDAYPDRHWLSFLAWTFLTTGHVGVGGPNLPPPEDDCIAQCVARSPGGPNHVLLDDRTAEHIPGCNMAFRRSALLAIGGFDARFHIAGDDVDVCWRLQDQGWTLGFNSAAVVWHHRRNTLKAYLRQQYNYGCAEGMLEEKWPAKYNEFGYANWHGRIYGPGAASPFLYRWRVYHGVWGMAAFQGLYSQPTGILRALPLMPDWYVVLGVLLVVSGFGMLWPPLLIALPLLGLAAGLPVLHAWLCARREVPRSGPLISRWKSRSLVALMHLLQPAVRLKGRLVCGLGPWRFRFPRLALPIPRKCMIWSETWQADDKRLEALEHSLRQQRASVGRGGVCDRWDLSVAGIPMGGARLLMGVEDHGGGRQLVHIYARPYLGRFGWGSTALFASLASVAGIGQANGAAVALGTIACLLAASAAVGCGSAMAHCLRVMRSTSEEQRIEVTQPKESRAPGLS